MKIKLLASFIGFLFTFSVVGAATFSVPNVLEVASGLTPGSVFYFLDNWGEWINLKLTFNQAKKAEKKLKYAAERLAELKALEEVGNIKKEYAEKIKNKYEELSIDAENDVKDLREKGQNVSELVKKMEAISIKQTAVLGEVLNKAPEQAKDAIARALEVSKKGHERAIEAITKEVEEGKIEIEDLEDELEDRVKQKKEEFQKHKEELKQEKSSELKEVEIDKESGEIDELNKELDKNEINDLDSDLNTLEKGIR